MGRYDLIGASTGDHRACGPLQGQTQDPGQELVAFFDYR